MQKNKEQVALSRLVFTQNWEDPESDHMALKIQSGDSILAITSGGCNVLGFLLFDPQIIHSIDINQAQSYLLGLKIAAIKTLSFEEFIAFAGLTPTEDRLKIYEKLVPLLTSDARDFWDRNGKVLRSGFIMHGKFEGFIKLAATFLTLLQGKKRVLGLFGEKSKEEQEKYFDGVWNTRRFHLLFTVLFNKRMLARRGLVADYFHFDDGSKSFAESFYKRSRKAFRDIPITGNYFLSLYLLGKYRNHKEVPQYLQEENFEIIKSRIDRINIITAEAQNWLDGAPEESISCFALSNICELMSEKDTLRLFSAVKKTARPGARVIFRNLMIPREVPETLKDQIVKDENLSRFIYDNDRSFVYGKVAAYNVTN